MYYVCFKAYGMESCSQTYNSTCLQRTPRACMRMSVTTPATFEPEQPPPTGKTAILFKLFLRVFRSFGGTADKMFSMARMVVLNGRGFFAAAMDAAAGRLAAAAGRFMLTGPGELEACMPVQDTAEPLGGERKRLFKHGRPQRG